MTGTTLAEFWARARAEVPMLPASQPEAWAFGATAQQADELLALVLAGVKTGTASSAWDYEAEGEPLPAVGDASVILDGSEEPRAVIQTVAVSVVQFREVDAGHAFAEGEGDRSLAHWRQVHERFWRTHSPRGFAPDMPVVCERFALIYSR
ncbi:ASCH domain-containing protein [Gryllotalpicola daejeonensis]|uniref:ASCH domain-containing protein n=1 Tax=Gryllotalpicola daejeonensis TaxID=993087 RepID=A0ABP7ZGT1_9MICO